MMTELGEELGWARVQVSPGKGSQDPSWVCEVCHGELDMVSEGVGRTFDVVDDFTSISRRLLIEHMVKDNSKVVVF